MSWRLLFVSFPRADNLLTASMQLFASKLLTRHHLRDTACKNTARKRFPKSRAAGTQIYLIPGAQEKCIESEVVTTSKLQLCESAQENKYKLYNNSSAQMEIYDTRCTASTYVHNK